MSEPNALPPAPVLLRVYNHPRFPDGDEYVVSGDSAIARMFRDPTVHTITVTDTFDNQITYGRPS